MSWVAENYNFSFHEEKSFFRVATQIWKSNSRSFPGDFIDFQGVQFMDFRNHRFGERNTLSRSRFLYISSYNKTNYFDKLQ